MLDHSVRDFLLYIVAFLVMMTWIAIAIEIYYSRKGSSRFEKKEDFFADVALICSASSGVMVALLIAAEALSLLVHLLS